MAYSRRIPQRITRTDTGQRRVEWATVDFEALTQAQVAAMFGVTPRTVQNWAPPRHDDGTYSAPAVILWYSRNADARGLVWR